MKIASWVIINKAQHYTTTTGHKARRLAACALGAAISVAAGVALLAAYFDVLI